MRFFSLPEARIMRFFNRDDDRFFESAGDEERRKKAIAQLTGKRNALFIVDSICFVSWISLPLLSAETLLGIYSILMLLLLYGTMKVTSQLRLLKVISWLRQKENARLVPGQQLLV
jgi:hypothetical protein